MKWGEKKFTLSLVFMENFVLCNGWSMWKIKCCLIMCKLYVNIGNFSLSLSLESLHSLRLQRGFMLECLVSFGGKYENLRKWSSSQRECWKSSHPFFSPIKPIETIQVPLFLLLEHAEVSYTSLCNALIPPDLLQNISPNPTSLSSSQRKKILKFCEFHQSKRLICRKLEKKLFTRFSRNKL